VVALRLETATWLDPPAEIELELKLHVTPELQVSTTEFGRMVLGPRAETVNWADVVPIMTTFERELAASEKIALPVPDNLKAEAACTALEVTVTLPMTAPELVGEKLTLMAQLCPTFKVAGMVGKLVPQLFVCVNSTGAVMLVSVTGWLPLFTRTEVWGGLV